MSTEMTTTEKTEAATTNGSEATRSTPLYRPNTDIYEADDRVIIVADMPGVSPDDVDITLEQRVLTIRGHVDQTEPDGYRRTYAEYGVGDYERVFTLSEEIDREKIEARQKDGVLTLELPKAEAHKPKKISVKAA